MVYKNTDSSQTQLLPTDIRGIIEPGHICYLIEQITDELDYSKFDMMVAGAGAPSYHPRIKLKVLLYGVQECVTSSRKLEKLTKENIIFRYLAENTSPDFHTLAMFRKENPELIELCFLKTVMLAKELGLINSQRLYLDGIKMMANASKKKNFTDEEIRFLIGIVREHLSKMDAIDKNEDKQFGKSNGDVVIPPEMRSKAKLKEAVKKFMKDAKKWLGVLETASRKMQEESLKQINMTDPDSRLMKLKGGATYKQAYNCQLIVEDKNAIIVTTKLYDDPTDVGLAQQTIEKFTEKTGFSTDGIEMSADNGYMSLPNILFFESKNITAYIPSQTQAQVMRWKEIPRFHVDNFKLDFEKNEAICPEGNSLRFMKVKIRKRDNYYVEHYLYRCASCEACKVRDQCIKGKAKFKEIEINPKVRKFNMKFMEEHAQEAYKKRFHKGEVAQANIMHNMGYRQFKLRNNKNTQVEMDLMATIHNLRKIWKSKRDYTVINGTLLYFAG